MEFGSAFVYVEDSQFDDEYHSLQERESDDEQPKLKKPRYSLLDETPRLIPAEDVSSDEDTTGVSKATDQESFDASLSVKNLFNATSEVHDWYTLGIQLDIEPCRLKDIQSSSLSQDNRRQEMFEVWLQSDPNASWEKLIRALDNMKYHCLSKSVKTNYADVCNAQMEHGFSQAATVRGPPVPKGILKPLCECDGPGRVHKRKAQKVQWDFKSAATKQDSAQNCPKIDTNVFVVKFSGLSEPKPLHTGDPVVCSNQACTAVLNRLSYQYIREEPGKNEKVWVCEFCNTKNEVDIMVPEEVPLKEEVLYMITPGASAGSSGAMVGGQTGKNALVVFCIDTSGSMGTTTEVPGRFQLKGHERLDHLNELYAEGEIQFMPHQRRNVTYVSRLQSVQAAIDSQLTTLFRNNPSQKVALITFNSEVTIVGNGRAQEVVVAGDRLTDYDALVTIAGELSLPSPVRQTRSELSKRIFSLEEKGQTALGPALLLSVLLAGQVPGSKVIICTDGLANRGVGSLDDLKTPEMLAAAQAFYSNLGTMAREKSVTVSVTTINACTECRVLEIGRVAEITGGQVDVVDPLKVADEFSNILATPVIATNVGAKIIMHHGLYIRTDTSQESTLSIPVGNVTVNTELSYEFGVRENFNFSRQPQEGIPHRASEETRVSTSPLIISGKIHLPFQLQIKYTDQDGSRCMRVSTFSKPVTSDKETAERSIDMDVFGTRVIQRAGALACRRKYSAAMRLTNGWAVGLKYLGTRQRDYALHRNHTIRGHLSRVQQGIIDNCDEAGDDSDQETLDDPVLLGHTKRRALRRNDKCDDIYCGDSPASYFLRAAKASSRLMDKPALRPRDQTSNPTLPMNADTAKTNPTLAETTREDAEHRASALPDPPTSQSDQTSQPVVEGSSPLKADTAKKSPVSSEEESQLSAEESQLSADEL